MQKIERLQDVADFAFIDSKLDDIRSTSGSAKFHSRQTLRLRVTLILIEICL